MNEHLDSLTQQLDTLRDAFAREQQRSTDAEQRYEQLFVRIPAIAHSLNASGAIIAVSDRWLAVMHYSRDEVLGRQSTDFLTSACRADVVNRSLPAFMASGYAHNEPYQMVTRTGAIIEGLLSATADYNDTGTIVRTLAVIADITDLKRQEAALRASEQERLALQRATIAAQEEAIRELSTPVLAIAPGIMVMPLIGTINALRAAHMLETLLLSVEQHKAHILILDITGLHMIDAEIAHVLLRAAQAVRLLGARVMLTGIRPEIAQIMVHTDLQFSDVPSFSSLQRGIDAAMQLPR